MLMSWRFIGFAALVAALLLGFMLWIARWRYSSVVYVESKSPRITPHDIEEVREWAQINWRLRETRDVLEAFNDVKPRELIIGCRWSVPREKRNTDAPAPATQPTSQPSTKSSGMQ